MSNQGLPESAGNSGSVPESPWERSNRIFDAADKLDWLRKMKQESGCTREEAQAWAEAKMAEAEVECPSCGRLYRWSKSDPGTCPKCRHR